MSEQCEDCGRFYYEYGDRVRLVQNHLLTGQVIGERNWHQEYMVRLGATITAVWLENIELEPDPEFFEPGGAAKPPASEEDNVIYANFGNLASAKAAGGIH
jgi:hypothetical protein